MDLTEEMQKYQRVLREYKEDICVSCHEPYTARDDDPVIGMCLACGEMEYSLDSETNDQQNVLRENEECRFCGEYCEPGDVFCSKNCEDSYNSLDSGIDDQRNVWGTILKRSCPKMHLLSTSNDMT